MGLLLSILVSCVGVMELVAFYADLRRGLRVVDPEESDLETVTCDYNKMLTKEYRQVFADVNGKVVQREVKTNFSLSTSPKTIFNPEAKPESTSNATSLDVKSIRVEIVSNCVQGEEATNVKPSPIKVDTDFQYSTNHISQTKSITVKSESYIEHTVNHTASHGTTNLETISIEVDTNHVEILPNNEKIYLLDEPISDPVHGGRSASPYPTYERLAPRGSICSELLENPTISLAEVEEDENSIEEYSDRRSRSKSRSSSIQRSSSPHTDSTRCRKSLSPINKPKLRIPDQRRHRSVSPSKRSLEDPTNHLQKRRRSKSSSDLCRVLVCKPASDYQLVVGNYWQRSPSPFEQLLTDDTDQVTEHVSVEEIFSDDFKNSLDGVKSKNPNEERKREFKRKRNNRNRLSQSSLDSNASSKENIHDVALKEPLSEFGIPVEDEACSSTFPSTVMLGQNGIGDKSRNPASNNVAADTRHSLESSQPGTSKEEKKPEPFWVN